MCCVSVLLTRRLLLSFLGEKKRQIHQQAGTSAWGKPAAGVTGGAIYRGLWHQRCGGTFFFFFYTGCFTFTHTSSEQTLFLNHDPETLRITRAGVSACRGCWFMPVGFGHKNRKGITRRRQVRRCGSGWNKPPPQEQPLCLLAWWQERSSSASGILWHMENKII